MNIEDERILHVMRQHPEPRPRDDRDAAQDIARDLADIAGQLASLKGEANAWLRDPDYDTLRLRLESTHAADSRLPLWRLDGG